MENIRTNCPNGTGSKNGVRVYSPWYHKPNRFFETATGKVLLLYLNEIRKASDFYEAVWHKVEIALKKEWGFICDVLNTHKSETLVKYMTEACGLSVDFGKKGKTGILKIQKSREEFLHAHPTGPVLYTHQHTAPV